MRRIWNGEPPFEGADPVGPPPVQAGGPPLVAGVVRAEGDRARGAVGRRRQRRVDARREPGRDGGRVRPDPRRMARRRPRRAAAPLVEHLVRARPRRARSSCSSYAYDYLKIFGDEIGRGAASMATCFGADALRQTVDERARRRRRRVLPRPDHRRSRRARRGPSMCSATSTAGSDARARRRHDVGGHRPHARGGRGRNRARRLRRPVVPRRARARLGVGYHPGRADAARPRRARGPVSRQPREPPARHRLAHVASRRGAARSGSSSRSSSSVSRAPVPLR